MTELVPPTLRADEREKLATYWHFFEPHAEAINAEMLAVLEKMPNWAAMIHAMRPEEVAEQNKRSNARTKAALLEDDWKEYLADLHQQGMGYAKAGISFAAWFEIIAVFRDAVRHRIAEVAAKDIHHATSVGEGMNRHLDIAMSYLGEAYLATKEEIIRDQQEAIRELSTPVLQVRDRLLIIPVVGLVDTHRARFLTEGLLRAIRERRARGVVMDITGVPIVDSKVANHLAQACEAARLMGAIVVMTGISSEIAQTLVAIGAQLRGVRMVGDLQGGIEEIDRVLARTDALDDEIEAAP